MAQTALNGPGERIDALRDTIAELLTMDQPHARIAAMMCGLDIHYDLGEGHPLLGRRVPDLDLQTPCGRVRLFTLLHQAHGVLLSSVASRATSTSRPGQTECRWSTRTSPGSGNCRSLARSQPPRPC
jgi:hypothetical protein